MVPCRGQPELGPGCYNTQTASNEASYCSKKGYSCGARTEARFLPPPRCTPETTPGLCFSKYQSFKISSFLFRQISRKQTFLNHQLFKISKFSKKLISLKIFTKPKPKRHTLTKHMWTSRRSVASRQCRLTLLVSSFYRIFENKLFKI